MLFFNYAQTFYLDKSAVHNAAEVALTRVDLFFRAKPPATNNKSGIDKPGVELLIVPTLNGVPVINQMGAYRPTEPTEHGAKFAFYSGGQVARVEYDEIQASTNASVPTTFLFNSPVFVHTDAEYAVIVKFDGNENYVLWTEMVGQKMVNTGAICTGPSGNFSGKLYQYIDDINKLAKLIDDIGYAYSNTTLDPTQANNAALLYAAAVLTLEQTDTNYLQSNWSPLPGECLKFAVHTARYSINGVSVTNLPDMWANAQMTSALDRMTLSADATAVVGNNILRFSAPVQTSEYMRFDVKNTVKDDLYYGEPFYQDGPSYPGGTTTPLTITCGPTLPGVNVAYASLLIQANGSYVLANGSTFNSVGGFNNIFSPNKHIIIKDGANTHFRQIRSITSNTQMVCDQPFEASITNATFLKAPIAYLNDVSKSYVFGKLQDLATFYNSTAKEDCRFTSLSLSGANIVANGASYSNTDYIKISGYEKVDAGYAVQGHYPAYANVVTNPSGNITAIYFSNTGSGFVNSTWIQGANVAILQSTAGVPSETPSSGTGANIVFTVGSNVKSLFGGTVLANVEIINIEAMRMKPEITVNNPLGTSFTIRHRSLYYAVDDANTASGKAYYVDTPAESEHTDIYAKIFKAHTLGIPADGKTPVLTSRSNEYIVRFANGALNESNTYGTFFSNTSVLIFDLSSNSDYQTVYFDPEIMTTHYAKYIINDNYTNEHTNYGEAYAKHVATKINMAKKRMAEDVLVYLTAYRPANTDFKVYARLHNSHDETAFDDTEWTLLEQTDGIGMYSSKSDDSNYIELTYNLPAYPNTDFTITGSATLTQGNAHIVGNTTIFGAMANVVSGGSGYKNTDTIYFTAPVGYTDDALTGIYAYKASTNAKCTVVTDGAGVITSLTLVDVGYGWASQQAYTTFSAVSNTGSNSTGTGASLSFTPGLQVNDLIKIYSPYSDWANINYTTAVVNSVVSNTELTVRRTFGELSANLVGNVSINTSSAELVGTDTVFTYDFSAGDFVAVWANSSVYETHKIISIANDHSLTMDANGTYVNTATYYAKVMPDAFLNVSTNVSNLKIDRLAYPHQAFNNIQNDNVARYYNSSMVEFDGYDTVQIKVVLLSDSDVVVPKADDIRGVLVTA